MTISMDISVIEPKLDFTMSESALPSYEGTYNVRPKVFEQTLHTANKTMARDVKIEKIPIDSVSNLYGDTVIIGG